MPDEPASIPVGMDRPYPRQRPSHPHQIRSLDELTRGMIVAIVSLTYVAVEVIIEVNPEMGAFLACNQKGTPSWHYASDTGMAAYADSVWNPNNHVRLTRQVLDEDRIQRLLKREPVQFPQIDAELLK